MVETLEQVELCILPLNTSCISMLVSPKATFIKTLLYCIVLLTVMLNLLVVISISHFRQLHTTTNVFLLSLAVSDLLVGVAVMPTAVAQQSCWFPGKITCALLFFLLGFTLTSSSVGSMVLISVDRYVAICVPLHYSSMITTKRAKICVSLCWICSVIYNLIMLKDHLSQKYMFNPCSQECTLIISYISGVVDFIVTFFVPVTVIIVLYMRVFVVAVSQARVMRSQAVAVKSRTQTVIVKKSEMRAARTLGIVLLVFIVCLCPYYGPFLAAEDIAADGSSAQIWLFSCNSTLNPLIYALFYPWFRRAIKIIVSLQIMQPGSCKTKIM
ncbi:trace amine-associated receptor 13c-like [Scomber japonicus]|uniref:trace amine-associated receptor 13c-like n=1 Tax=Scomber japonicus TaxID=13676 RepID=UPI0023067A98|nr:trace amine-associated receptor 13c-like [Scomber japonicus]